MSSENFVHLHCHTEFSLLDGMNKIKDVISKASNENMPAVALTDHGTLFGALEFYLEAEKKGIKPIIGCEVYVAPYSIREKGNDDVNSGYHLVLLAKNNEGLSNLFKLCTKAQFEGFYYKPRVDKELLQEYYGGLIALSGCLQGEVNVRLLKDGAESAIDTALEYKKIFGEDFYLEIQANNLENQNILNSYIPDISKATGIPMVATNDCHYLNEDDKFAHDVLLCIQTNAEVQNDERMKSIGELHFKTESEMRELIDNEEAILNTINIAEKCNIKFDLDNYKFPVYDSNSDDNAVVLNEEFAKLSREGLAKRFHTDILETIKKYNLSEEDYNERLEHEIQTIIDMGFPGYFLIVQDFINWAKKENIAVGPGRGSAAGSLVAYALGITEIDPLPYNLLFERFLNPERISMPDIDVDFCERRRGEVCDYVSRKYGEENVAHITTFGTMKSKSVIRDVGRAMGFSFPETSRIANLVPDGEKLGDVLKSEPELTEMYNNEKNVQNLIDTALKLEGLHRHASTHAAGVVIADKSLVEYSPLYKDKKGKSVSQFDMNMLEKAGLIKFDFLGLRTMTTLQDTASLVSELQGEKFELNSIPLDDPEVYKLFAKGNTDGLFQVESKGMQEYLQKMEPKEFEDLIAMLALYRPGPLGSGMVDSYMERRAGREETVYPCPEVEDILKATYGIIVYQEQVMQIAQKVAGYSLGEADILRKAMGKKKADQMAEQRDKFVFGALENGFPKEKAEELFELMEKFASYGFNKSHSASYALISYWTGYFKTYYPVQYMASLLSNESQNEEKVLKYIDTCRGMGIDLDKPNVNYSQKVFTALSENKILFGLSAIKGIGDQAIENILKEREKHGGYKNLKEFCRRTGGQKITKTCLQGLVCSGAFDCFEVPRQRLYKAIEEVPKILKNEEKERKKRQKIRAQKPMLKLLEGSGAKTPEKEVEVNNGLGYNTDLEEVQEWDLQELLQNEHSYLGFFLSSNPLREYSKEIINRKDLYNINDCMDLEVDTFVHLVCLPVNLKSKLDKNENKMAFMDVVDLNGDEANSIFFSKSFQEYKGYLDDFTIPVVLSGYLGEQKYGKPVVRVNKMAYLKDFLANEDEQKNIQKLNKKKKNGFNKDKNNIVNKTSKTFEEKPEEKTKDDNIIIDSNEKCFLYLDFDEMGMDETDMSIEDLDWDNLYKIFIENKGDKEVVFKMFSIILEDGQKVNAEMGLGEDFCISTNNNIKHEIIKWYNTQKEEIEKNRPRMAI